MDIVIPVHNGPIGIVKACIESVVSARPDNGYDIQVIDDHSTSAEIIEYLDQRAAEGRISLNRNERNLGFTLSVNRGMGLHADRDVILLNSDTVVYADWARRLQAAAGARRRVATANPISNGWMSNYPQQYSNNNHFRLEVSDEELDRLSRKANDGRVAEVYGTIRFCMFIARRCLAEVGLFDDVNFPRGYGEETDFCYRARRLGWTHIVAGNVFVRHWENASFGSEKTRLIAESFETFGRLHPGHLRDRENFVARDPLRELRRNLDRARARRLMAGASVLPVVAAAQGRPSDTAFALAFSPDAGTAAICVPDGLVLPNLDVFMLPRQIAELNRALEQLGIAELHCASVALRRRFLAATSGWPFEEGLKAKLSPPVRPPPCTTAEVRHEPTARCAPDDDARIDVIVPVYNQRTFVESCLASVLGASNKAPFELVVVDDASTDDELKAALKALAGAGRITLLTNETNLGFTRSVNRGMQLHPGRDVVLLNSDTLVFGDWLDRLRRAARAHPRIGTANPLSNGSHIGCYPFQDPDGALVFEVDDVELDAMAAEANRGRLAEAHYIVGFCMYIRRTVLDAVGLFDAVHFPIGYGEEADFCLRASRVGWRHVVAGDVFVRHWEGQSFQGRKAQLMNQMTAVFRRLHPGIEAADLAFRARDPVRPLREALDLARLRRMRGGAKRLACAEEHCAAGIVESGLLFTPETGWTRLVAPQVPTLASLPRFLLPDDIAAFNATLARLGVTDLSFEDEASLGRFAALANGRPMDLGLCVGLSIAVAAG